MQLTNTSFLKSIAVKQQRIQDKLSWKYLSTNLELELPYPEEVSCSKYYYFLLKEKSSCRFMKTLFL